MMTDTRRVEFTKLQGTGNDFVVIDNRSYDFSRGELSSLAEVWCRRRYGVGADGLLALGDSSNPEVDYRMLYVNADGSWATMCGNGARCLARFARRTGLAGPEVVFETDAGLYRAVVSSADEGSVRLFVPDVTEVQVAVRVAQEPPEGVRQLCFAHAGTEHLVAFVDGVETIPVGEWGASLRYDSSLEPAGANVNFVRVLGTHGLRIRTYEKGVEAETPSCGTGVLAAVAAAERVGEVEGGQQVSVRTEGGSLRVGIEQTERGSERYLEGPAEWVFEGTLEVEGVE